MTMTLVPKKRAYPQELKYESSITYHSKGMANIKNFSRLMDKRSDKQTDGSKTISQGFDQGQPMLTTQGELGPYIFLATFS